MNESSIKRRRGRPKKEQTGFSETKAALIRTGMEILTEKGFAATGIDAILRTVNVPKGSFYHYFASKEAYGLVLIEHYSSFLSAKLTKALSAEGLEPLARLALFMEQAERSMAKYNYTRGCLVGNLSQEIAQLPESFRDKLGDVLNEWQILVAQCFEHAKQLGHISTEHHCDELAYMFWNGWEGAVMRAKLEQSGVPLQRFSTFFIRSIQMPD
ncbi:MULTISPECIES: TetR/AcrR family transcriptional regulator [Pseudoalteromonas]|uniref:TetR/AcrR family transcriptional regulator, transcriptional repressor for nem operon n=1 Tax=Pseudoalteromonas peptidolytica F12-50-A1 TaxID=1315280 RepID=A0A8I0MYJ1_9GAMM|nr:MULTISPECIES: TetR/AcrR family transcriptional regulator [Pseudoalteromonas]MBE0347668.1 TetR/AcrR family transcriptional regulator, transcriptional repressor for nem operon [Pseudoalteromonas peptidolytica F12-50-A1]MDW7549733.1 TetR family transcriptional regulator C-terminal domain-containing protein [Pseudoalteromonas peptidolytica]NLR16909.1 TetR family transcriptional regulator [Pseudoalteromonas peptidolytica]RXE94136.1 TetR family transcriptional regulator [Pseudoalteromonas sp. PS5]